MKEAGKAKVSTAGLSRDGVQKTLGNSGELLPWPEAGLVGFALRRAADVGEADLQRLIRHLGTRRSATATTILQHLGKRMNRPRPNCRE